ncbi:hypothetical protein [Angelakisella massiliensis]|uniref:hypothetical protein n=1 Tax=Angelakisella massiliensis TaxID=1871018 RepID=UPI0023A8E2AB|nr:hypothetical protein [Angelakisella massiliensis]
MKLKVLLFALCACLLLSSCMPLQSNVEELMQPPKLTEEQFRVEEALHNAVGADIHLKYPRSGSYRSAFTFFDLDEDGSEEAIVLYSQGTEAEIRIAILANQNGQWSMVSSYPGLSFTSEVDFIRFESLSSRQGKNLVIGWGTGNSVNNIVTVYTYDSSRSSADRLVRSYIGDYSQVAVDDFNRDGLQELLLVTAADGYDIDTPTVRMVGEMPDGNIDDISRVELNSNIASFLQPVCGLLSDGMYGAVVDCYTTSGMMCTVAIVAEENTLTLPLNTGDGELFRKTSRHQEVLSGDINADGVLEIPLEFPAPGHEKLGDDALYLTNYSVFSGQDFETVQRAFVNQAMGYRFCFPKAWEEEQITVMRQGTRETFVFYVYHERDLYDQSEEVLRLRSYSTQDAQDKLETNTYFSLGTKGTMVYCAALPENVDSDLILTQEEVQECFSFLY